MEDKQYHWIQPTENVKIIKCKECGIETAHHRTASGDWTCWCGAITLTPTPSHPSTAATGIASAQDGDGTFEGETT